MQVRIKRDRVKFEGRYVYRRQGAFINIDYALGHNVRFAGLEQGPILDLHIVEGRVFFDGGLGRNHESKLLTRLVLVVARLQTRFHRQRMDGRAVDIMRFVSDL